MVEVVRGLRYRKPGDKIFGTPIRPVSERIDRCCAKRAAAKLRLDPSPQTLILPSL